MTDADKILQALAGLQHTVEKQGKSVEALHKGQKSLQDGQKTLQATVERQGKQLTALQDTVENQSKAIAARRKYPQCCARRTKRAPSPKPRRPPDDH